MTAAGVSLDRRTTLVNGVGVILLASILFGVMAVCVRVASRYMGASQITFVRFSGSLLVLLAATRGRGLRPQPGNLRRVLLRGVFGACAITLYYHAIQNVGAGLATLVNCTYPVFTALFATILMGERFDGRLGVALVLNLIGVIIVLAPGTDVGAAALAGGLSALGSAVFAGGAVATARELRTRESALLITTYFMAVGMMLTAPALLLAAPELSSGLLLALGAVVLTSVSGQVLLHQGLGFAPATEGSLAAATSVVTATLLEAALLGEHLSPHSLVGAGFMMVAVGLAASRG